jgi:hypothetical protein
MARCAEFELRRGEVETARRILEDLEAKHLDLPFDPRLKVILAELLFAAGDHGTTSSMLRSAAASSGSLPEVFRERLNRVAERLDPYLARVLSGAAAEREHAASPGAAPTAASALVAQPLSSGVLAAIPRRLAPKRLVVELAGKGVVGLRMDAVRGVSAAQIQSGAQLPYTLIDLLIEGAAPAEKPRLVRIVSTTFDAQFLLPQEPSTAAALRALVHWLLAESAAPQLIGSPVVPFPSYPSLVAYESDLAKATSSQPAPS